MVIPTHFKIYHVFPLLPIGLYMWINTSMIYTHTTHYHTIHHTTIQYMGKFKGNVNRALNGSTRLQYRSCCRFPWAAVTALHQTSRLLVCHLIKFIKKNMVMLRLQSCSLLFLLVNHDLNITQNDVGTYVLCIILRIYIKYLIVISKFVLERVPFGPPFI